MKASAIVQILVYASYNTESTVTATFFRMNCRVTPGGSDISFRLSATTPSHKDITP
jgi:hypothetical protein